MTNDGTLITKAKNTKGGFAISNIFFTDRSHVDIALATKSKGFSYKGYIVTLTEKFTQELDNSGFYSKGTKKFSVLVDHSNDLTAMKMPVGEGFINTNDFDEANEFFKSMVVKYNLDTECYLTDRYTKRTTNTHKTFDYLTFLREESNNL